MAKYRLKDERENLRGRRVIAVVDGKPRKVEVVTHIRDGRWMVEGSRLPEKYRLPYGPYAPKRTIVSESDIIDRGTA